MMMMMMQIQIQSALPLPLVWDARTSCRRPVLTSNSNSRTTCTTTTTCASASSSGIESEGAYRLIDRQTGHQGQSGAHHTGTGTPTKGVGQSGFAKLKVQKVKSLMTRRRRRRTASPVVQKGQIQVKTKTLASISHDNDNDDAYQKNHNGYEPPSSDDSDDDDDDDFPTINHPNSNSSAAHSTSSGDAVPLFSGGGGRGRAAGPGLRLRGWGRADYSDSFDRRTSLANDRGYSDAFDRRTSLANDRGFFSKTSYNKLGCTEAITNALSSLMFLRPSHIQAMAFRAVLQGKSCIIADQSGSGKTLAYLCPLIQRLKRDEEALPLGSAIPGCPRVIVLAPTAELASQVLTNCRLISKSGIPFRSMVTTGGFKQKTQLESLQQGLDILIATPGRFLYLYQHGFLHLSHLQCIVLDEVDILYGEEGFEQVLQSLISAAPVSVQYLFVTATLPLEIYNKVVEVFPDCEVIMGPGMHRTSSGLEEVLVDCSGGADEEKNPETSFSNKKNALLKLVQESPVRKTIVFCNKIETCRKVENVLKRVDRKEACVRVLPFHAALTQDARLANLKEFLKSQSADSMFLVCTDRASRGIDFEKVDHVVLFDFPREPSEYMRRVGRTARGAGGVGKAFVFAVGKQVSLAARIIERNRKGHPLHRIPTAYELQ